MNSHLEKRVMRKVTLRIVPFIMLLYFIAFLDRVNIGFAALTMNQDLGFSPTVFGFGAGIFFLGYFLFEVPSNLILHKVGARIWIARVMITWGLVSGCMAFVQGTTSFYLLRFLLGVAEAGFFPGIILYLSYWFPAAKRAQVTAIFMAAAPLSTALGSPISAALLEMHGLLGFAGWQWMFVLEAIPALLFGIVVLFYLTDRPAKAKWLTDEERAWLETIMQAEEQARAVKNSHSSAWRGLMDKRVLALALVYFGTSAGLYRSRSGGEHRHHQLDRQPWRFCRPDDDWRNSPANGQLYVGPLFCCRAAGAIGDCGSGSLCPRQNTAPRRTCSSSYTLI